jgi:hypothetical protein
LGIVGSSTSRRARSAGFNGRVERNGYFHSGLSAQVREITAMNKRQEKGSEEIEARWKEFWDDHQDFESPWARTVLHQLEEFLPFVFKFDAVRHGLEQLYTRSGVQCPADWDWSHDWTSADEHLPTATLRQLPIFRLALALDAYAYYGLKPMAEEPHDFHGLDDFLDDLVERTAPPPLGDITLFPHEWTDRSMEQTTIAALARRKLDHPEVGAMTPEELAALVKLPRKNIVNLLAPANRGILKSDSKGLISIESARSWLSKRDDFRPSIWQQQGNISISAPLSEPLLGDDPIYVPVASDGTWFSPNNRNERDGRYYVASGDHEEKYEDYWAALDFLEHARSPRWRYRDAAGRWRAKTGRGDDWLRKTRAEIETLLRAISRAGDSIPQPTKVNAKQ